MANIFSGHTNVFMAWWLLVFKYFSVSIHRIQILLLLLLLGAVEYEKSFFSLTLQYKYELVKWLKTLDANNSKQFKCQLLLKTFALLKSSPWVRSRRTATFVWVSLSNVFFLQKKGQSLKCGNGFRRKVFFF